MNRFRKQAYLTWFAFFAYLFVGYQGAGFDILCVNKHHVRFETSNYGWTPAPIKKHGEPANERHGNRCLDISLSIGDVQPAVQKNQRTDTHFLTPDVLDASSPAPVFEKISAEYFHHPDITGINYTLASLGSVILLI